MKCLICTFPVTAQFEIQRADLVMESLWIIGGKWSLHIKQILHYIGIYFSFGPFTKALVNLCFVKRPVKNKYQYTWYNAVFVYHCLIHVLFRHYEMLHINCWNNDIGRIGMKQEVLKLPLRAFVDQILYPIFLSREKYFRLA